MIDIMPMVIAIDMSIQNATNIIPIRVPIGVNPRPSLILT